MQVRQIETTVDATIWPDRDSDLDRITEFAQQRLGVDDVAVIEADALNTDFDDSAIEIRLAALVIEGGVTIAVPDVIFERDGCGGAVRGFLGVPIHDVEGKPFAVLYGVTRETRVWSRSDREMLSFLAGELEELSRMRDYIRREVERAARHRLVAREYHHRIRNAFSVSSAVVVLGGAQCPSVESLVETTSEQLSALADAHASIGFDEDAADLAQLVKGALRPYTFAKAHVDAGGPPVEIAENKVISFGLIFNELATNSIKYGAFRFGGTVRVSWSVEGDQICLLWGERSHGPRSTCTKRVGSFGSAMMDLSVKKIGATLGRKWQRDGLEVMLTFPA